MRGRHALGRTSCLAVIAFVMCCVVPIAVAAPSRQRSDGLDTPLLSANSCGTGAPDQVHFTLAATGDTFPHENVQAAAETNGYDWLFDRVRPFLEPADLAYTNFDGAMLEGSPLSGYPMFNFSPQLATALRAAGIDVVSTANNHILDRGPEGLDATLRVLEQNGILQHGTVRSDAQAARPAYLPIVLEREGVKVKLAFLSFTWGTNGVPDPHRQVNLLWKSDSYGQQGGIRPEVLDAVALARREADLVVVAAHWGLEYQFYPADWQVEGARQLAAAGADVVLGSQSHTLQPVDIVDTNGRKTLVIYSLANFLASQGPLQEPYYSATATIFYVGFVREPDGRVHVTGYRYLPTIHVDRDTRPAPIAPGELPDVIAHVRTILRDPLGARQVPPDPAKLGSRLAVCEVLTYPDRPGLVIGGDFAQYVQTFGGAVRSPKEQLQVFGYPLAPVRQELAGDCATTTSVLLTERQRLEWHPEADWPYRVVGTPLGTAIYQQTYPERRPEPRTGPDGAAIDDLSFKQFWEENGGLQVFGYPISGLIQEIEPKTGKPVTVQYFERARFELVPGAPPDAPVAARVRLGLLGMEYAASAAACGQSLTSKSAGVVAPELLEAAGGNGTRRPDVRAANLRSETSMLGTWALIVAAIGGVMALALAFVARRIVPAAGAEADLAGLPAAPLSPTRERKSIRKRVSEDEELLRRLLDDTQ